MLPSSCLKRVFLDEKNYKSVTVMMTITVMITIRIIIKTK